jgi:voltage-gated potassium channel
MNARGIGIDTGKTALKAGIYELLMLGLCVYVLLALTATTFFRLDADTVAVLEYFDAAVCVVFLLDFFVKLATAESKLAFLRWGWIDFISSIPTVGPFRWGRLARVVRILRLLRGVRSAKVLTAYVLRRRGESVFAAASFTAFLIVVFSSVAVLHFEREADSNISSPDDAIWWAFVTVTTVGYGDKYPVTTGGRIVACLAMTAGVGLFGTFTGFVASWFLTPGEKHQGDELQEIRERLASIESLLKGRSARDSETGSGQRADVPR